MTRKHSLDDRQQNLKTVKKKDHFPKDHTNLITNGTTERIIVHSSYTV